MNNDVLNVLIRLYEASDAKTIITDNSLNVLWTSCESLPEKLSVAMFSRNNIYPDNKSLFPIEKEQLLYFNDGFVGYTAKVTPMISDSLIVISLLEPMDILRSSVFSGTSVGMQNTFSQIREAITQIYSIHIILKEMTNEREEELYPIFKRLENSCCRVLGALSNYTELFTYAEGVANEIIFDAGAYTKELCYLCESVLREQNISIECEADSPATIRCSYDRFTAAILNIIANGIAYNISEKKTIKVTVKVQDNDVIISIYDNGIGISSSELERSSVPFGTARLFENGSGLGLSVVREFAKSCDGSFFASSSKDSGTGIHLKLPLSENDTPQLRSPIKDSLGSAFSPISLYLSKFSKN